MAAAPAAPALQGAPPNPGAMAATAAAANLYWDATLVPPTVPGGPPAPAVTTLWNGLPPMGPNAWDFGHCSDRVHHGLGPLAHNCASHVNPVPPPPGQAPGDMLWHQCPRVAGLHGPGFMSCYYCLAHTRTQPWWLQIFANVTTHPLPLPWPVGVPQPLNGSMGFQTHLCRECEVSEQKKLLRIRNPLVYTPAPPAQVLAKMIGHAQTYPENTCTCLYELVKERFVHYYCVRHRHTIASNRHNTLLITRQQNDNWLRSIGRIAGTTQVGFVSAQKKNGRATRRVFRACRCGAEIKIKPNRPPEVFMCMGCEGVIHVGPLAAGGAPTGNMRETRTRRAANANVRLRRQ